MDQSISPATLRAGFETNRAFPRKLCCGNHPLRFPFRETKTKMNPIQKILALAVVFISSQAFAEPVALFDGKTLDGWESPTPELWKVNDGVITGGDGTTRIPHNDFLCTKKSYQNFTLRMMIRMTGDPATGMINSGIQIRSQRVPNNTEASGYQCDYGDPTWWGSIYDEARRNRLIAQSDMEKLDPVLKRDGWNEYVIRAEGPRIRTFLNGVQGVDYTEEDPKIAMDGIIGIQVHSGGNTKIEVKDITIDELPPTPGAPTWDSLTRPGEDSDAREDKGAGVKPGMNEDKAPEAEAANTPEQELATFTLPDGFEAELVAAEIPAEGIGKFVQIAFDAHGALWTTTALEYPVDGNENPAAADALYSSKAKDKVLVYDRDPTSPTGLSTKPRVFAEGLAIPLGVLPFGNGCYVQQCGWHLRSPRPPRHQLRRFSRQSISFPSAPGRRHHQKADDTRPLDTRCDHPGRSGDLENVSRR